MSIRVSHIFAVFILFNTLAASQIPTAALMGYYPFNGNALDESCNNNHGNVIGALPAADRFGNSGSAYQFNGQTDKITFDYMSGMKFWHSPKSFSFWFKSGATGRNMTMLLIGCPAGDSMNYIGIGVDSDNRWRIKRTRMDYPSSTSTQYLDNQWHFCAYVNNNPTQCKLFIDSLCIDSTHINIPWETPLQNRMQIGAPFNDAGWEYSGLIDDVRIYDRALSDAEVLSLFHESSGQSMCPLPSLIGPQGMLINEQRPRFKWFHKQGITNYVLQVANDSGFNSLVFSNGVADTTFVPTLDLPARTLYWRVGDAGNSTLWSRWLSLNIIKEKETGLVAYYPLGQGDLVSSVVNDSSGYSTNGETESSSISTDRFGTVGNAFDIRYPDAIGIPGEAPQFRITDALTISAWVKFKNEKDSVYFIRKTGTNGDLWALSIPSFVCRIEAKRYSVKIAKQVSTNTWNHIAGVWDGAVMKYYLNGELQPETTVVKGKLEISGGMLKLGLTGSMDDVRIYRRALSSSEISALYHQNNWPTSSTNPILVRVVNPWTPRPAFIWRKTATITNYTIQLARDICFKEILHVKDTPDTFYTPAIDLPIGIHYWRVGKSADTSTWSKIHTLWENDSSVIMYFPLDGDSGKVLADASGKSNTGYINGYNSSPKRVAGICGEALNFNGSTDQVLVNNADNLNCARMLTIACWVNVKQLNAGDGAGQTIIEKAQSYVLGIGQGGKIGFKINDGANGWKGSWTFSAQTIQPLCWNHIAGVWDGKYMKVFINGVEDILSDSTNATISPNVNNLLIGKSASYFSTLQGSLDEIEIHNTALSAETILNRFITYSKGTALIPYIPTYTYERRPLLQWHAKSLLSPYTIQISTNGSFNPLIVSASTADTFYTPTADLPAGTIYWRVGNGKDSTAWSNISTFVEQDSTRPLYDCSVPDQYPSVREAVKHGKNIIIKLSIVEDLQLNGVNVSITGADTSITISGKASITNSTVEFRNIKLVGHTGNAGDSPLPGITYCPTAGDGTVGGDALEIDSSTIYFYNCKVTGGKGGDGGKTYINEPLIMPCDCGNSGGGGRGIVVSNSKVHVEKATIIGGKAGLTAGPGGCSAGATGTGIVARNSTTVDTVNIILGTAEIDATSKVIAGKSVMTHLYNQPKKMEFRFLPSGMLQFSNTTYNENIKINIYSLSGKLVFSKSIRNEKNFTPLLPRGTYVASITNGKIMTLLRYTYVK
jgi:hypothetical protein